MQLFLYSDFSPLRFDMVNVHLKNRPDWFVAKTPHIGKVPLIEYQGAINYESFVLQEFLEEKFPEHTKLSADTPEGRARDKYMVELSKRVCHYSAWAMLKLL